MREILQNNLSVPFKSIKVMNDKVRWKSYSRLGEAEEIQELNALDNYKLDPGTERGY